ncbi:hypothetical protein [Arthrobacter alpinus]|uniref:hypothetical protein n=1 Tax=Arthrobacter alpinus TaxID=656366 RepID=UPI0011147C45|nr:hypothetical protein [Arthrobacter alpinus]
MARLSTALKAPGSSWQEVIENAMAMPKNSPHIIRGIWGKYVDDALADAGTPDPIAFTPPQRLQIPGLTPR